MPAEFRSGWFVESLATQTLVIFAIRTRRVPFFRSHPSLPLTLAALGVVAVGACCRPLRWRTPSASTRCRWRFFAALAGMVVGYLALIEAGKRFFYRTAVSPPRPGGTSRRQPAHPPARGPLQHRRPAARGRTGGQR